MKNTRQCLSLILAAVLLLSGCTQQAEQVQSTTQTANISLEAAQQAYMEKVDVDYSYNLALKLEDIRSNEKLGYRTAGSEAELATGDMLKAEMERIGLQNVTKDEFTLDTWTFEKARMRFTDHTGAEYTAELGGYQADFVTDGAESFTIIDGGEGTEADLSGLDVAGKLVLIDINQRENWWINYPAYEAHLAGAAAVVAVQDGGYAEVSDDALNAQDICGPSDAPAFSMSRTDAEALRAVMGESGETTVTLDADSRVGKDGRSYNIVGTIPGRDPEAMVLMSAHYDSYFAGFQDDNAAIALMFGIAKAIIDSGYQPENDIVFCLHGAEEWGSSYTQYDWTVGAWEMINNVHPDWVGKTLAFINFELPAYEFDTYTSTYSAPEMYTMLADYANTFPYSPEPEGCFPDGVLTDGFQTYTYSDDFSYYAAGVPSTVNGFLLQKDMETVFPLYENIYHSQYDNPDTYNEAVINFNIGYYGVLAIYIDQTPALYLDFTAQYDRILAAMDEDLLAEAGVDVDAFHGALEQLKTAAETMRSRVESVNADYLQAREDNDAEKMAALWAEGRALTDQNLKAFEYAQKHLLGLMYERPIVPHEAPQENIQLCRQIIDCLETGDVAAAVDEYAWTVNNVLEWYAMYFSPEVIAIQDDMLWGEGNRDNLYWGTGISVTKADVDAATRSLFLRYEETGGDFSQEIGVYQAAVDAQMELLGTLGRQEIEAMDALAGLLAMSN